MNAKICCIWHSSSKLGSTLVYTIFGIDLMFNRTNPDRERVSGGHGRG